MKGFAPKKNKAKQEKFSIEDKKAIGVYQKMLFLKDKRDDYRRESFYSVFPLVKEIAKRLKITLNDLGYLMPQEIFGKDIKGKILNRKKRYIVEVYDEKVTIISGKKAVNNLIGVELKPDVKIFSGIVGYPGQIIGKAQIINKKEDLYNFKRGNILVAATTSIDYVPAMNKAIGFITNEGGITCHAAIVAREMKKPCIIGTKIATKALKDGDLVEVDAEKGIVKKL